MTLKHRIKAYKSAILLPTAPWSAFKYVFKGNEQPAMENHPLPHGEGIVPFTRNAF